jgi:hypothetical protein
MRAFILPEIVGTETDQSALDFVCAILEAAEADHLILTGVDFTDFLDTAKRLRKAHQGGITVLMERKFHGMFGLYLDGLEGDWRIAEDIEVGGWLVLATERHRTSVYPAGMTAWKDAWERGRDVVRGDTGMLGTVTSNEAHRNLIGAEIGHLATAREATRRGWRDGRQGFMVVSGDRSLSIQVPPAKLRNSGELIEQIKDFL